ncbi:MAG: integrase arm-type DNA-binding domain-containing protein [Fretibacterium sp.]|nr:integrase arm-type DNA-binding domain-containing protein [Fretibacterium sp.]
MLTELQAKAAKPKEKRYMLRDDRGLYLRVDPSGRKYWIFRYWEQKKERQISLGPYPDLSMKDARLKRDEIQTGRAKGQSPYGNGMPPTLFSDVAEEWMRVRMKGKAPTYMRTIRFRLGKYILPGLENKTLEDISPADILRLCRQIEGQGHYETARRVKVIVGQVFRFAIAAGWIATDPTLALQGALCPRNVQHYATLTDPSEIATLMKAMTAYPYTVIRCAMLFSIYTFARPGEIRAAEWAEIKGDVWDIPSGKMKMKRRHMVPLSRQAQAIIEELRPVTGRGKYLFPSPRNDKRCMSENGVRVALRCLGFGKELITPHGFRSMFSTIANERGWNRDVIERQLAHVEQNQIRGAYNHAEYLSERIRMMQWWADWLDGLER